jgi:hypothetical protein
MDMREMIDRGSWTPFLMAVLLAVMAVSGCTSPEEEAPSYNAAPLEDKGTILTVKQLGGADAIVPECSDIAYLEENADYIIDGTVISVDSRKAGSDVYTYSEMDILAWGKGSQFPVDGILVVTAGGTAGGITQTVEDQPTLHQGSLVRLYIQKSGWDFTILCGHMGVKDL